MRCSPPGPSSPGLEQIASRRPWPALLASQMRASGNMARFGQESAHQEALAATSRQRPRLHFGGVPMRADLERSIPGSPGAILAVTPSPVGPRSAAGAASSPPAGGHLPNPAECRPWQATLRHPPGNALSRRKEALLRHAAATPHGFHRRFRQTLVGRIFETGPLSGSPSYREPSGRAVHNSFCA
jgi:hypothetical protein